MWESLPKIIVFDFHGCGIIFRHMDIKYWKLISGVLALVAATAVGLFIGQNMGSRRSEPKVETPVVQNPSPPLLPEVGKKESQVPVPATADASLKDKVSKHIECAKIAMGRMPPVLPFIFFFDKKYSASDYEDAMNEIEAARELDPDNLRAISMFILMKSWELYEKKRHAESISEEDMYVYMTCIKGGINEMGEIIRQDKQNEEFWLIRCILRIMLHSTDEWKEQRDLAMQDVEQSLRLFPDNPYALYYKGAIALADAGPPLGDPVASPDDAEEAVRLSFREISDENISRVAKNKKSEAEIKSILANVVEFKRQFIAALKVSPDFRFFHPSNVKSVPDYDMVLCESIDKRIQSLGRQVSLEYKTFAPDEIFERCRKAVVLIRHSGGLGSGFVAATVSPENGNFAVIVTNRHVLEGSKSDGWKASVRTYDGKIYEGRTYLFHNTLDLASMIVEGAGDLPTIEADLSGDAKLIIKDTREWDKRRGFGDLTANTGTPLFRISSTPDEQHPLKVGDRVVIIGHPGIINEKGELDALKWTMNQGSISKIYKTQIQTDTAANPGNSGGPMINMKCQIAGVLTAGVLSGGKSKKELQGTNMTIRGDIAVQFGYDCLCKYSKEKNMVPER